MSINYRYFKGFGIEVVKCENSAISYPVHTHISTFVIGLVLKGEVCLGVGQSSFTCGANQIFTVPPDTAHSLSAKAAYTLISICIDKNLVSDKNLLKERLLVLMNGIGEISHLNREKILNKIDLFEALPDKKTKIVALKNYIER
ncbi:MAG: AraC family ligand binding domain-containing protein, partial [Campylobacteraceae bacterium]|nr:AraC family ligand binding domain-containing protein [Campylobacteraceae bacterium]